MLLSDGMLPEGRRGFPVANLSPDRRGRGGRTGDAPARQTASAIKGSTNENPEIFHNKPTNEKPQSHL